MDLNSSLDCEYGLQQDEWSLSAPTFGKEGQLTVIGWSGKSGTNKFYILKCAECSQDFEMFGEGYFKGLKGDLIKGKVPCGCGQSPRWSDSQYEIICRRKAVELGYTFLGFEGQQINGKTKVKLLCEKHGEWNTCVVSSLNCGTGCPKCGFERRGKVISVVNTKSDDVMIASFFSSGIFHPDTKFWRSGRKNHAGFKAYWYMDCPECGETGESVSSSLQLGRRSCACSPMRQKEAYINLVLDEYDNVVALKFGIAIDSLMRIKRQNRTTIYDLQQYSAHRFPDVASCRKAERDCLQELECGVVLKRDMPDGYSETTWAYNIGKVKDIYERNGGVLVE